jgi:hypothetical protein
MFDYIVLGVFVAACVFMLVAVLLPIVSEPGKEGWDDVN